MGFLSYLLSKIALFEGNILLLALYNTCTKGPHISCHYKECMYLIIVKETILYNAGFFITPCHIYQYMTGLFLSKQRHFGFYGDPALTFDLHGSEINSHFAESSVSSWWVVIFTCTVLPSASIEGAFIGILKSVTTLGHCIT